MGKIEQVLSGLPPHTRKLVVALVGFTVLLVGVVMIPYPGPGWLVVFMGLAILAQEFLWARRALLYGKAKYDYWTTWVINRHPLLRAALLLATFAVVVATIWLVNGYGLLNSWLHLHLEWLNSPFV